MPPQLVKVFQILASEGDVLRATIVSARQYPVPKTKTDVPWLDAFSADGGNVVITGDTKMRAKLVELKALADHGLITIFFHSRWNNMGWFAKTAMLIKWWPVISMTIQRARKKQCFEVPCNWSGNALREVTPPKARKKPGRRPKKKVVQSVDQPRSKA